MSNVADGQRRERVQPISWALSLRFALVASAIRHKGMLPLMHKGHKQVCTCVLFVIVENV
ncbi:hypothetical protein ANCDUO_14966 [Ancylostoma duodenale]|uniref:Uncharacterized protein n=1 Tax=Ancylostoma duodenale TaxID=51022 RepID=A0A0C2CYK1_9BILA|nr:hypothetical protein ANCDUO_14966 [Ancylostoma duodenale]